MKLTRTERVVLVWVAWASLAGLFCTVWRVGDTAVAWTEAAAQRIGGGL